MIQTVVTPINNELNLILPNEYIGKNINVICYSDDEIKPNFQQNQMSNKRKASDYIDTLSKDVANEMLNHVEESRKEWNRNI